MERELDIPVFHDDQHGTAIVVTAALINALRVVNKKMEDVHIVLNGPGAAGTAIIKMLMTAGAKDIVAADEFRRGFGDVRQFGQAHGVRQRRGYRHETLSAPR